jgi:hypothetical protein
MPAQQFANNAQTTLSAICNPGDSSISVVSAAGFPTSVPYTILIDSEFMLVTSGAATTTWGVSRAQEGSTAGTHASTAAIEQVWTVAGLQSLEQAYFTYWGVSGLTGAIQPSRYAGATGTGTPGSGTFQVGDFIVIQTGGMAVCTVAGTPGTWVSVLPNSAPFLTHIVSTGPGTPTTSGLSSNVASVSLGPNSTDTKGTLIITISGSPVTLGSSICTVNFNTAFSNGNYAVVLTQSSAIGTTFVPAVNNKVAASFGVWCSGAAMTASAVYNVDYVVVG